MLRHLAAALAASLSVFVVACGGGDPPAANGAIQTDAPSSPATTTTATTDGADAAAPRSVTTNAPDAGGTDASDPYATPVCLSADPGSYCGSDMMKGADPSKLYTCAAKNEAPTAAVVCANGCAPAPAGEEDYCHSAPGTSAYRLPWSAATSMELTQDCNDSCCNDHVGIDAYAWDFGRGGAFVVVAARGGTITHLKIDSTLGCGSATCVNDANYIVIDHGDGTQSTYLHLQAGSLAPGIACGATVTQGQPLATSGTTGWSSGVHLHFQINNVDASAPKCECGMHGMACAANQVTWANFWVTPTNASLPIKFEEWPAAAACANRRIAMPTSKN